MGYHQDDAIFALFLSVIRDIRSARCSSVASSTIIVYDHLVTLDQEIELIWKSSWTLGKIMFLLNRYYPLCCVVFNNYTLFSTAVTDELCFTWVRWQGWTALIASVLAEIILQVRIYALYFMDKKILLFVVGSFITTTVCSAGIMGSALSNFTVQSHIIPGLPTCTLLSVPDYLYTFWIPILAFESLLCGMALFRGIQTLYHHQSVFRSGRHLMTMLLRDSVIYYLIVFAAYLTNLLIWSTGKAGLLEAPVGFTIAMSCVIGNRLILNVRNLKREMEEGINGMDKRVPSLNVDHGEESRTGSVVVFASRSGSTAPTSHSALEFMELRDIHRPDSPPQSLPN